MIQFDTWWFPDGETHTCDWMRVTGKHVEGRLTYQYHKYEAALRYCPQRRRAVDVGAHVGLWSYWMARDFAQLEAFEPIREHRDCWQINMMGRRGNATLHPVALGAAPAMAAMTTEPISSGATFIDPTNTHADVMVDTLDALGCDDVDFIKIDVEGTELDVIQGGLETIRRCRPVMVVEQKGNEARHYGRPVDEAVACLQRLGMVALQPPINGDWILGWRA